jgi:hypothetical protein
MTGDGADQVDGIEYDACPSVVHYSHSFNVAELVIWRRRRKYSNELDGKWPNLLFPPRWQFACSIVFLPQAWGKIAGAGVIALNTGIVLLPEVAGIVAATMVIALVVLAFALPLVLVFSREANGHQRTDPKQGNQELSPIHGFIILYLLESHDRSR